MAKKILKTLVNNLGFKILAVVLAFILWLVAAPGEQVEGQRAGLLPLVHQVHQHSYHQV